MLALVTASALAYWLLLLATFHLVLAPSMRARGLVVWRLRDTLLVSPLFALGTLAGSGGLAAGVARGAWALGRGEPLLPAVGVALGVALAGSVVAAFGIRAVGKLY